MNDSTPAALMQKLGVHKEAPPSKNGTRSKWARFPWDDWVRLLKMTPDESYCLHEFDKPDEAQKARQSKICQAVLQPGIRFTAVNVKDETGAISSSKLYGVYEPELMRRDEEGTHLQRRDSPR